MVASVLMLLIYVSIIVGTWFFVAKRVRKEMNITKDDELPLWIFICLMVTAVSAPGILINLLTALLSVAMWIIG